MAGGVLELSAFEVASGDTFTLSSAYGSASLSGFTLSGGSGGQLVADLAQ